MVVVYYKDTTINLQNFENPIQMVPDSRTYLTNVQFPKTLRIKLMTVTTQTDEGFFSQEMKYQSYTTLESTTIEHDTISRNSIFGVILYVGQKTMLYTRSYKKYDLVSAEVTGVLGLVIVLARSFLFPILVKRYYFELINKMYDITIEKEKNKSRKRRATVLKIMQQSKNSLKDLEPVPVESDAGQWDTTPRDNRIGQSEFQQNKLIININDSEEMKDSDQSIAYRDFDEMSDSSKHEPEATPDKVGKNPFRQRSSFAANQSQSGGTSSSGNIKNDQSPQNEPPQTPTASPQIANYVSQAQKKPIKLSFGEWVASFLPFFKTLRLKRIALENGVKKMYQQLDIFEILTKVNEIDRLKAVLLSKDQLMLFEHLPKPAISPYDDIDAILMMKDAFIQQHPTVEEQSQALREAYERLLADPNKTRLDRNFVKVYEKAMEAQYH